MPAGDLEKNRTQAPDGHLFIVSAPSGAGKTTLCRALMQRFPDLWYSVSYTTRLPRSGEQDGVDYHFISVPEFTAGQQTGQWAEWAFVHGNYYGTSAVVLQEGLDAGRDILLDIDVQGMRQIVQRFPESVTIFVMPPSLEILRQRLTLRCTDSRQQIDKRLETAKREMAENGQYRHVIVNDDLPRAIETLVGLVREYRSR
jgi:guanylate kinase